LHSGGKGFEPPRLHQLFLASMSIRVHLYSGLHSYANNQDLVEVEGVTVGECLNNLVRQFPDVKRTLFDAEGKLLSSVLISINLQSLQREDLNKNINPGDEIYLILIIPGG
jgi:molybdopterin converting factor small subunit